MEYVYGTAVIDGVMRENLKIIGGQALKEGEYLTTVREYDDNTITDRCRIDRHYHTDTGIDGTRYDFYAISDHYRYIDKSKAMEATRQAVTILEEALAQTDETAIALFEEQTAQQEINAQQDEALMEIFEMLN